MYRCKPEVTLGKRHFLSHHFKTQAAGSIELAGRFVATSANDLFIRSQ